MIVDDTPENLRVLSRALTDRGYRVMAFPSGALALRALESSVPDIALLDVNMPGMNGYELCEAIRALELDRRVPILFISAMQDTDAKLKAFDAGGLDYITKPFQLEEVYARVETHLELASLQRRFEEQNAMLQSAVDRERQVTDRLQREGQGRVEAQQYALEYMARMAGLAELSDLASQFDNEQDLLKACGRVARRVTGAERIDLILLDASGLRFQLIPLHAADAVAEARWMGPEEVPWLLAVLDSGAHVSDRLDDEPGGWAEHLRTDGFRSAMALAVRAGTTTVGVLCCASRFTSQFSRPAQSIVAQFAAAVGANLGLYRALKGLESSLDRADAVLVSVLPRSVSRRLKRGESQIADRVPQAGVFFCDLAGFTAYSSTTEPESVVKMLQETFSRLEERCVKHKVEKIKTIGDAFMAVSGVSVPVDNPALAITEFALDVGEFLEAHLAEKKLNLGFRIGIHVGPVLAGVIGSDRLFFDVWGDTVNFASRLESPGQNGDVRCSDAIRESLGDGWEYQDCGLIELKGKGAQQVWKLVGRAGDSAD